MAELLPCPFCGGKPSRGDYDDHGGREVFVVACGNEACPVGEVIASSDTRDDADSRWNTRAPIQRGAEECPIDAEDLPHLHAWEPQS